MITKSKFHLVRLDMTEFPYPKASAETEGLFDTPEAAKSQVEEILRERGASILWRNKGEHFEGDVFSGSALLPHRTRYSIFSLDCASDGE